MGDGCHDQPWHQPDQEDLEELLDPGWPLQEGFVWDPQHGNTPRKIQMVRLGCCYSFISCRIASPRGQCMDYGCRDWLVGFT